MKRNIYLDAQKTDRLIINLAPIFFALIAFFSSLILGKRPYKEEDWTSILSSLLGMWATLLGFMITAVSVLLTFKDGAFITILKKSGHYNTILLSYSYCCIHLFVALVITQLFVLYQVAGTVAFAAISGLVLDIIVIVAICLYLLYALVKKVE